MIADPDFDLDPAKAREESKRLVRDRDADARNMISAGTLAAAKRLPGTLEEARAIAPRLKFLADAEPEIYWNQQALEGVFKTVRHPRLAVLSTHAFFLNDAAGNAANWENPLLRCGLLFAGANRRQERQDTTGDDGVLTGLEITGVDLRGTELVVLSACDTGVGELRAAEGVAGLRQAFHLAGARAVLATLWPISDRQTVPLMTAFFEELAAGRDHAEALQKAQQSVLHTRRMNNQAAHPYYWAAFSLTGP
jgi:CHAT domain-containing protein